MSIFEQLVSVRQLAKFRVFPMATRVVAICGPTGAGKTTLAKALSTRFRASLVSLDEFMKPTENVLKHDSSITSQLPENLQNLHEFSHNYEHPSCIDWDAFAKRIADLSATQTENGDNLRTILVEGHLLFSNPQYWRLFSKSIALVPNTSHSASSSDALLHRRWSRDYSQTCSKEHFKQYWNAVIWPSYLQHGSSFPEGTLVLSTDLPPERSLELASSYIADLASS